MHALISKDKRCLLLPCPLSSMSISMKLLGRLNILWFSHGIKQNYCCMKYLWQAAIPCQTLPCLYMEIAIHKCNFWSIIVLYKVFVLHWIEAFTFLPNYRRNLGFDCISSYKIIFIPYWPQCRLSQPAIRVISTLPPMLLDILWAWKNRTNGPDFHDP